MPIDDSQLLKDVLSMPETDRIALVERLLSSLDSADCEEIDGLWGQESEERIDAFERGEIASSSAKDVFGEAGER